MTTTKKKKTTKKPRRSPRRVKKKTTAKATMVEVPGTGVKMERAGGTHEHVPTPRPYVFTTKMIEEIAVGVKLGLNVVLTGPTGCGKTSVVRALASHLNRPFVRFNMNGETRVSHLVGMNKPATEEGALTLKFSAGAMVEAMREGYWVLLDEIDAALPQVLMVLQPVLEEDLRTLYVPETGEPVRAHDDFRLFATGNTIGYRSTARMRHAGTNPLNDAFVDRFGMVIDVDYPPRAQEIARVKVNCPGVDETFIDGICRVAEELRTDEKFKSDFSTRRCVQWARLYHAFAKDDEDAILRASELAVVRKMTSPTDAAVTREVIRRIFGYETKETR